MNIQSKRSFYDLFKMPLAAIHAKFDTKSEEIPMNIIIQNKLRTQTSRKGKEFIESICTNIKLKEFAGFYQAYDGFDLAIPVDPRNCIKKPLLRQISATEIKDFTNLYLPGGRFDWTIDLNKTKNLYRNSDPWIAFAEINDGPRCLTTFLDGGNAGHIFLLEPQPQFNILKPIASSYNLLLERIAKEPAEFLKLIRASVLVKGDNYNYGYTSTKYFDSPDMMNIN